MIRKHTYTAALIYFKKIFHFLTFQTSKLPKTVAKKQKNMTSFPCSVRSADFLPYACQREWTSLLSKALSLSINCNILKLFPQGSRHRSHHTQKVVPNVVARHQLLNTSPDNGIFPIKDMSRLMRKRSSLFSKYQNRFIH